MFQSAITSREYEHFVEVCKRSEEEARALAIKYTNTDQALLHDLIDAIWHDGGIPQTPFFHSESVLQEKISRGDYKKELDEGHHRVGHF